jgi:hypothetical protein
MPLAMITSRGFNCYFPMPFNRSARITVTNDGQAPVPSFYYQIDYETYDQPPGDDVAYFHARWHRENPTTATDGSPNTSGAENYVILEARGGACFKREPARPRAHAAAARDWSA